MAVVEYEWDNNKSRINIEKHGIDFDDAIAIFDGQTLEGSDDRFNYNETRIIAFGKTNGHVLAVVYTMRGGARRIISARKANQDERKKYHAAIAARSPGRED